MKRLFSNATYAARAKVVTLPLEHYEKRQMDKIVEFRKMQPPETAAKGRAWVLS